MKNNKLFLRLIALVFVSSILNFAIANNIKGKDKDKKNKKSQTSNQKNINTLGLVWNEVGADNLGGRTRALIFDKNNPAIVYAGAIGGGLWKSTTGGSSWYRIASVSENMIISCITQAPNGSIFVGTGESFAKHDGCANGSSGFLGGGIYRSTDGISFSLLPSTNPTTNDLNSNWAFVNDVATDISNKIYAATNKGLMMSSDNGDTWINLKNSNSISLSDNSTDVSTAPDGTVIASVGTLCYLSNNGSDASFVNVSSNGLPNSGIGRSEFAISPSNSSYIYASLSDSVNGKLKGIYRSTDKGATWTVIGPGNSTNFQPFGVFGTSPNISGNGNYANTIKVFPNNPNKIILGGSDLWVWQSGGNWEQRTSTDAGLPMNYHTFAFHPNNPNMILIGTDGGILETNNGGSYFYTMNKNYSTLQFNAVATSGFSYALGGTQNSGSIFISGIGTKPKEGFVFSSNYADNFNAAGYSCISKINKDAFFISDVYGAVKRTPDANVFSSFLPAKITTGFGNASYIAPMILWESNNDLNSSETVTYALSGTDIVPPSSSIMIPSGNFAYPFWYTNTSTDTIFPYDTIVTRDIVQTKLFLGTKDAVWMTKKALDFSAVPLWFKLASISGLPQSMAYSTDGNYLFVGTSTGNLYRISNILQSVDSTNTDITSPFSVIEKTLLTNLNSGTRAITSISVDPLNSAKVVVTLGGYNFPDYIYQTTNALDSLPTFALKQGDLPAMPVYSSIYVIHTTPNVVLIGTEKGIYSTSDITASSPSWSNETSPAMGNSPVYMLSQKTSEFRYINNDFPGTDTCGTIFAATQGRGLFKSNTFNYAVVGIEETTNSIAPACPIKVFPNPADNETKISFELKNNSKVVINILGIDGRLIKNVVNNELLSGNNKISINCSDFPVGTYFVQLICKDSVSSSKFVVIR